eukprot:10151558-Alexandrium_andersonii.AAC.1
MPSQIPHSSPILKSESSQRAAGTSPPNLGPLLELADALLMSNWHTTSTSKSISPRKFPRD